MLDLSVLAADFVNLLAALFPSPEEAPSLVVRFHVYTHPSPLFPLLSPWNDDYSRRSHNQLLGHSMGGTAVVHACPRLIDRNYRVAGVAVLDVVEGSSA